LTIATHVLPTRKPQVYLAGPSVFRPNAKAHLAELAALCERHGLNPLLPTDDCGGSMDEPLARRIYAANTRMLRSADAVLADLQEWRGHEPDSGTAFEVGFAAALGLPIVGYGASEGSYAERVSRTRPCERDTHGTLRECASQMAVEDFGMPLNLMLGCSAVLVASAEEGLALLASMLGGEGDATPRNPGSFDRWLHESVLDEDTQRMSVPATSDPILHKHP
jgi:nucleoside 2-deoxyribosyltransferase